MCVILGGGGGQDTRNREKQFNIKRKGDVEVMRSGSPCFNLASCVAWDKFWPVSCFHFFVCKMGLKGLPGRFSVTNLGSVCRTLLYRSWGLGLFFQLYHLPSFGLGASSCQFLFVGLSDWGWALLCCPAAEAGEGKIMAGVHLLGVAAFVHTTPTHAVPLINHGRLSE